MDLLNGRGHQCSRHPSVDGAGGRNSACRGGRSRFGWRNELADECSCHMENMGKPSAGRDVLGVTRTGFSMTQKSVPLSCIKLSVVVTVYSETFSIDETLKI